MLLEDILDSAGVEVQEAAADENERRICCPMEDCGDTRFRLGINLLTGEAHCYNCQFKARGVWYTARQLCKAFGIDWKVRRTNFREETRKLKKKVDPALIPRGLPEEFEKFSGELDFVGKKARRYLKQRGISTLQIVKHKIGFAGAGPLAWRVIFPVVGPENKTYGCVGRAIRDDMTPKYLNTPGLKLLWNAQQPMQTAVVVEGIMDALHVETALLQRRNMIAVARLGSAITTTQMDQLKEFEKVIILPDWDRAGIMGAQELAIRCTDRGIATSVAVPQVMSGLDPGAMTEEQIMQCICDADKWSRATEFRLQVASTRNVEEMNDD